ncbi:hypothetical protein P1J78_01170 [Psychromarinibacter sp. C21-152]|uniref:SecDF P1 head subdomain domain-containing protein n=1 Tax=Psychromarinibacter sediminicola TaxID=3033385 RepID=A0AAE3NN53_9RHOB|nr:hypothetical protein [Psychromarinibacter sediminicola]MDF0599331.1 hypothetical protein [Psychromarinibacter sediminicola]
MEPDGIGALLGAIMAATGTVFEPGEAVDINDSAPEDFRPLTMEVAGESIAVHPADLRELMWTYDPAGTPALAISFDGRVAQWLGGATHANVGRSLALSVCGEVLSEPVIREAILGGAVQITGDLGPEDANALLHVVAGQVDCAGRPIPAERPGGGKRSGGSRD